MLVLATHKGICTQQADSQSDIVIILSDSLKSVVEKILLRSLCEHTVDTSNLDPILIRS